MGQQQPKRSCWAWQLAQLGSSVEAAAGPMLSVVKLWLVYIQVSAAISIAFLAACNRRLAVAMHGPQKCLLQMGDADLAVEYEKCLKLAVHVCCLA